MFARDISVALNEVALPRSTGVNLWNIAGTVRRTPEDDGRAIIASRMRAPYFPYTGFPTDWLCVQ